MLQESAYYFECVANDLFDFYDNKAHTKVKQYCQCANMIATKHLNKFVSLQLKFVFSYVYAILRFLLKNLLTQKPVSQLYNSYSILILCCRNSQKHEVELQVLHPLNRLLILYQAPSKVIRKRHDKLLDYDNLITQARVRHSCTCKYIMYIVTFP